MTRQEKYKELVDKVKKDMKNFDEYVESLEEKIDELEEEIRSLNEDKERLEEELNDNWRAEKKSMKWGQYRPID